MKKRLFAAVLAASSFMIGAAQAAVLEFDVGGVFHSQGILSGSFLFDTTSQSVTDISVTGGVGLGSVSYNLPGTAESRLVRDGTDPAPFNFTTIELYFDAAKTSLLKFDIFGFNTVMPGLAVGGNLFLGTDGIEIAAGVGSSAFVDSTIIVTRLADPAPNVVPLPAGLPLLLVGLGSLGLVRRRKKA